MRRRASSAEPGDRSTEASALRVEVVSDLARWRSAWDELVDADPHAGPFVAGWWVDALSGDHARIVLVFDRQRLVGGLALQRHRAWGVPMLTVLGEPPGAPDLVDVVARPSDRARVLHAVGAWWVEQRSLLVLRGLRHDAALIDALGPSATVLPWSTAPVLRLDPASEPRPRSSRVANTERRARRRLERSHGYRHRVVDRSAPAAERTRAIDELVALHRCRWPDGSNFVRSFAALRPALVAGFEAGAVSIHEGVGDDAVLASMVVFDHGKRRCYYQSGRLVEHEFRGVGTVLMADVVRDAWASGFLAFDFLRGREPYKLDWGDVETPLVEVVDGVGLRASVAALTVVMHRRGRGGLRWLRDRLVARRDWSRRARDPVR